MSDSHRNAAPGRQGLSATGIAEVLEAYSTHGGQLMGARRWAQNPLTLTHVRWVGPRSAQLDAVRAPEKDATLDDVELQVWIELALDFPAMHPSAISSEATWLTLNLSPQQAAGLAVRLARALASAHYSEYGPGNLSAPSGPGTPPFASHGSYGSYGSYAGSARSHAEFASVSWTLARRGDPGFLARNWSGERRRPVERESGRESGTICARADL